MAQQDGKMNIIDSRYSNFINQNSLSSIMPIYEHNGNFLSADSGILYKDEIGMEFFEAFDNVVITQPSGTKIFADKLHYDATSQLATLRGNVKLVGQNSVLTTNYLTYNMRSKTGTYRSGGRIISQTDTITSKNAYYFENTSDAYFRHDVIVRTPNVKVYTDSMRYNSLSKMTYFFGPTNIKGTNNENLYTEKGTYNTESGIANFSKNNLYTEGSKFLKGDSLHYNRAIGIGEAFRNVVFVDTLDKFYAYGGKGTYRQDEESILMTEKPYIITVVKNDSTAKDSTINQDSLAVAPKEIKKANTITEDKNQEETTPEKPTVKNDGLTLPKDSASSKVDSVYMTADTLYSRMILAKDYLPLDLKLNRDGGELIVDDDEDYGDDDDDMEGFSDSTFNTETDSLKTNLGTTIDSIKSNVIDQTNITKNDTLVTSPPKKTISKPTVDKQKKTDSTSIENTLKADSVLRNQVIIPPTDHANTVINQALKTAQTQDSVVVKDSTQTAVSDTTKTRIVKAYYNVRLFKSDFQAVADSVYYGMQDSMFRFMGKPMIWAEESQISSDTIFMQIVNQQIDNALLKDNAFMVNAVLDTVKFNQLKGRRITAFFANNNIDRLFVDGNAENLVFAVNEKNKVITEMFHDRGGRIKVKMEGKEIVDYVTERKVDQKLYPFAMVTQENEILPGFIWRPQDRPKSKEDLLNRKREAYTVSSETNRKNEENVNEENSQTTESNDPPPKKSGLTELKKQL